jgi:hypothetical protein
MDLHFITLAVGEGGFSGFRSTGEHSPWRDDKDSLGNYSDDTNQPCGRPIGRSAGLDPRLFTGVKSSAFDPDGALAAANYNHKLRRRSLVGHLQRICSKISPLG